MKELLKQRGVTYAFLADALSCSLPTIKRCLNKTSLPLDRLLQIAEVANIEFAEICERAEQLRPTHYVLNDEQDELFASRPEMLYYLEELLEGRSPAEIASQHKLDKRSTEVYQQQLEHVGLIKRRARNQVKLLVSPPIGFGPGSRYLKKRIEGFMASIFTEVVQADESDENRYAVMKPLHLTKQDYKSMLESLNRVVDQYSVIGEGRVASANSFPYQLAIASGTQPKPDHRDIPRIKK